MILLKDYINNPCRTLSIPYWKQKNIKVRVDTGCAVLSWLRLRTIYRELLTYESTGASEVCYCIG